MQRVQFTVHAVERFIERCAPHLAPPAALAVLKATLPSAVQTGTASGAEIWRAEAPACQLVIRPKKSGLRCVTVLGPDESYEGSVSAAAALHAAYGYTGGRVKLRWRGRAAKRALPEILIVLASRLGRPTLLDGVPICLRPETLDTLRAAGLRVVVTDDGVTLGNPGSDGVLVRRHSLDLDVDGAALATWRAALPADVLAMAVEVHAHKPRLGRTCKLGVRVSPTAALKLRSYAERRGLSEAAALDHLLLALP